MFEITEVEITTADCISHYFRKRGREVVFRAGAFVGINTVESPKNILDSELEGTPHNKSSASESYVESTLILQEG